MWLVVDPHGCTVFPSLCNFLKVVMEDAQADQDPEVLWGYIVCELVEMTF